MPARTILRMGDPRLLQPSEPVTDFGSDELRELVKDMFETMSAYQGVGLAAPQIGVLKRVVIFGFDDSERYPDADSVPKTILINPQIQVMGEGAASYWEGCLSVPGMRGLVTRPDHILYSGFDLEGQPIEVEAQGFHATVVQHECDHLDGILYPMRMQDMSQFGYSEELDQYFSGGED